MQIVTAADDIDYANGITTPADRTTRLAWDGSEVELDLTHAHIKEIDQLIGHLLRIGRPVHEPKRPAGGKSAYGGRAYLSGLRAWADAEGRGDEYRTKSGGYYYPKALRAEYEQFRAGR